MSGITISTSPSLFSKFKLSTYNVNTIYQNTGTVMFMLILPDNNIISKIYIDDITPPVKFFTITGKVISVIVPKNYYFKYIPPDPEFPGTWYIGN